ncbi:MAG: hypothetical protein NVV72_01255 [Asticcacaulis sp.]|nr:hypothetical protein [Asticcacaulis sp.]
MTQPHLFSFTPADQYRVHHVLDMLDGFSDGIDADRLAAGIAFARSGIKPDQIPEDLVDLFASFYLGAKEAGEWTRENDDSQKIEAKADIERIMAESLKTPLPDASEVQKLLHERDRILRDLRNQIVPFDKFKSDFADELVKQFGQEKDKDGDDVREYGLGAAEGYYDDPDMWEDGTIDPAFCAKTDLSYWETE